jgi:uncharacterized protein (DUF4415 family)
MTRKRIPPITAEEEAEIQRIVASDPDAAEATDEEIAQARPFVEAFPDLAESIVRARPDLAETVRRARGRPKLEKSRRQISIRLDPDVIEKFKATGKGWQTRINEVLRAAKL